MSRSDEKRDECSFHPPTRTRGVIGFVIICITCMVKIKNIICNKIIEIILYVGGRIDIGSLRGKMVCD